MIGPFLADRKGFLDEVVNPLQEKEETVYVVPDSDAEAHVEAVPAQAGEGGGQRDTRALGPDLKSQ